MMPKLSESASCSPGTVGRVAPVLNLFEMVRRILVEGEGVEHAVTAECDRRASPILPLVVDLLRSLATTADASPEDSGTVANVSSIAYGMIQAHREDVVDLATLAETLKAARGSRSHVAASELLAKLLPTVIPEALTRLVGIVRRGVSDALMKCERDAQLAE
jgi:hypothetical protein